MIIHYNLFVTGFWLLHIAVNVSSENKDKIELTFIVTYLAVGSLQLWLSVFKM